MAKRVIRQRQDADAAKPSPDIRLTPTEWHLLEMLRYLARLLSRQTLSVQPRGSSGPRRQRQATSRKSCLSNSRIALGAGQALIVILKRSPGSQGATLSDPLSESEADKATRR